MQNARSTSSDHAAVRSRKAAVARLVVLALICFAMPSASLAASPHRQQGKAPGQHDRGPRVKQRPSYWGAWIGDQLTGAEPPWNMSAVTKFEQLTGKGLSLVEFSTPFYDCGSSPCTPLRFPTAEMESVRDYGAIPFLSWGSDSTPVPVIPNEPDFQLSDLIAGRYDAYIREFAEAARNWGHGFFLRFNWEMNGDWFPWGQNVNGAQPGEVVAAWQHVHDIFASVGATNATWVWCPYADPAHKFGNLSQLYPGNAYVDWTCMDGFNWAANPANPHPWKSFDQIFASTYRKIVKKVAPGKPVILAELASTGGGRAKAAWITKMFKMLATKYRRVRGLIWFDRVDRGVSWPLETSPAALGAFARGIRHWAFKSNGYASSSAASVRPPS
jgi:Glycosyl hydrolase family 26